MTSFDSTIESRPNASKVDLPYNPTLEEMHEGGGPPAAIHGIKETAYL